MVSHVKSKIGSVQGSVGEGLGELDPIVDPPVWGIVPDGSAEAGTTYQINMNLWVTGRGLEGWALTGNPAGVTIDALGIVTILDTVPVQVLSMTCYVENIIGNDTSNVFEWELEAVHVPEPPVWDIVPPQSTPDSNLPDQLDMNDFVTSFLPIIAWTTTEGTITEGGILVIPAGTPVGVLSITVTAENADGVSPSAPFDWEITLSGDEPEWGTVPDREIINTDLPYQEDMNDHIIAGAGLTGWALSGNPASITIDGVGLMTATGTPVGNYTMTCYVENSFGSDTSNSFTWSVIEIPPPVWDEIPEQENDDRDHPVDLNLVPFVTTTTPLTDWTTDVGSVDGAGLLTVPFTALGTQDITVGVTNDGGTEQTTFEWTTLRTAPDIDTQPVPLVVDEPDGGQFTVEVSHPNTTVFSYLWQAEITGNWGPADEELSDVAPGTHLTNILILNSTIAADTGRVRCRIRSYNDTGGEQVFTDDVALTVTALGPPVWDDIPNDEILTGDFPYTRQMSDFVTAPPEAPVLDYTTDTGTISQGGFLQILEEDVSIGGNLVTVFAHSTVGSVPGDFLLNVIDASFEGYHHEFNADLGGFTFVRGSPQTGIAADGIIYESVDDDPVYPGCTFSGGTWIPSSTFRGLQLEGASENLIPEPVDFDTSGGYATQGTTIELDVAPSPVDGFLAAEVTENNSPSQHELRHVNLPTPEEGNPAAQLLIVKSAERPYQKQHLTDGVGGVISKYDLLLSEVTTLPAAADMAFVDTLDDGWRVIGQGFIAGRAGGGTPQTNRHGFLEDLDGSDNYQGDGVSGGQIAGWQLEFRAFPSSFMFSGPRSRTHCYQPIVDMIGQTLLNDFAYRIIFELHCPMAAAGSGNKVFTHLTTPTRDNALEIEQLSSNTGVTCRVRMEAATAGTITVDLSTYERGDLVDLVFVKSSEDGYSVYLDGELEDNIPGLTQDFGEPLDLMTLGNNRSGNSSTAHYITVKSVTLLAGEGSEIPPPTIDTQPEDLTVTAPNGGQFTVVASHPTGPFFYAWQIYRESWTNWDANVSDGSGGVTDTAVLNSSIPEDSGLVRCRVRAVTNDNTYQTYTDSVNLLVNPGLIDPPEWETVPDWEVGEDTLPQSRLMADYVETTGSTSWTADTSNSELQINASSGELFAQEDLPVGTHQATVTVTDDGGTEDSNEFDVIVIAAEIPPDWHTPIPNQSGQVLNMPLTFDANDYVSSAETIAAWSTVDSESDVDSGGIVSLPRRGVGVINNDAVTASNSSGTTQSTNFNWNINPSIVVDEDFSYANGPLEGNGQWQVLDRADDESHTVSGGDIVSGNVFAIDATDVLPDGESEFFMTIASSYNQIIPGLEDQQIGGIGTFAEGVIENGIFINTTFGLVDWLDSTTGDSFRLNVNPSTNDTYGFRTSGNTAECIKNGDVVGSINIGPLPEEAVLVLFSVPFGGTQTIGFTDVTFTIIG